MELSTIIFILIGAFLIWALFFRQIDLSSKTDDQLRTLYNMARSGTKDLPLIEAEMQRRGLLDNPTPTKDFHLGAEEQKKLDEANRFVEESGLVDDMRKMIAAGVPEKILQKTSEIAAEKGVTMEEASSLFNERFEAAVSMYKEMGCTDDDAERHALNKALITKYE